MQTKDHENTPIHNLFIIWCRAEFYSNLVLNQVEDDMGDPLYVEAVGKSKRALWDFLCTPTSSLYGILLKLKVACHFDDYTKDALDPQNDLVGPRAIVSALHDLENVVIACFGAEGVKKQDEDLDAVARCGVRLGKED